MPEDGFLGTKSLIKDNGKFCYQSDAIEELVSLYCFLCALPDVRTLSTIEARYWGGMTLEQDGTFGRQKGKGRFIVRDAVGVFQSLQEFAKEIFRMFYPMKYLCEGIIEFAETHPFKEIKKLVKELDKSQTPEKQHEQQAILKSALIEATIKLNELQAQAQGLSSLSDSNAITMKRQCADCQSIRARYKLWAEESPPYFSSMPNFINELTQSFERHLACLSAAEKFQVRGSEDLALMEGAFNAIKGDIMHITYLLAKVEANGNAHSFLRDLELQKIKKEWKHLQLEARSFIKAFDEKILDATGSLSYQRPWRLREAVRHLGGSIANFPLDGTSALFLPLQIPTE